MPRNGIALEVALQPGRQFATGPQHCRGNQRSTGKDNACQQRWLFPGLGALQQIVERHQRREHEAFDPEQPADHDGRGNRDLGPDARRELVARDEVKAHHEEREITVVANDRRPVAGKMRLQQNDERRAQRGEPIAVREPADQCDKSDGGDGCKERVDDFGGGKSFQPGHRHRRGNHQAVEWPAKRADAFGPSAAGKLFRSAQIESCVRIGDELGPDRPYRQQQAQRGGCDIDASVDFNSPLHRAPLHLNGSTRLPVATKQRSNQRLGELRPRSSEPANFMLQSRELRKHFIARVARRRRRQHVVRVIARGGKPLGQFQDRRFAKLHRCRQRLRGVAHAKMFDVEKPRVRLGRHVYVEQLSRRVGCSTDERVDPARIPIVEESDRIHLSS